MDNWIYGKPGNPTQGGGAQAMDTVVENLIVYNVSSAARGLLNGSLSSGTSGRVEDGDGKLNLTSQTWTGGEGSIGGFSHLLRSSPDGNVTTAPGGGSFYPQFYPPGSSELEPVLSALTQFAMPVVLSVGILGNIALVVVFMCTPLRRSALANYLTAAGVTNAVYLLCSVVHWFTNQGFQLLNVTGVCQLTMFALHLSKFLATWYLILAHLERLIIHFSSRRPATGTARHCQVGGLRSWSGGGARRGVLFGSRVRKWCGRFRAKCIIVVVFVFSMVGFLHYIWTYIVQRNMCYPMPESMKHIQVLHKIEMLASSFIPALIIIVIDISLLTQMAVRLGVHLLTRTSTPSRSPTSQKSRTALTNEAQWRGEYTLASTGRSDLKGVGGAPNSGRSSPQSSGSRSPTSCRSGDRKPTPPELDLSREQGRATLVVVVEGILFMAIVVPSSVLQVKVQYEMQTRHYADMMKLVEEMVKMNAAVKFFLYLLILTCFRQGLFYLLCRCCRGRSKEESHSLQETSV